LKTSAEGRIDYFEFEIQRRSFELRDMLTLNIKLLINFGTYALMMQNKLQYMS